MTIPKLPLPAPRSAQKIRVVPRVDLEHSRPVGARRHDDLRADQVVAGHPEVAGEETEAAAEGGAGKAHCPLRARRRREVVLPEGGHRLRLGEPRADLCRAGGGVDVDVLQLADVDHDAVVDVRPAFQVVPTTAYPQRDVVLSRPGERVDHVLGLLSEDDDQRIVHEQLVPAEAGLRVVGALRADDPAGQLRRRELRVGGPPGTVGRDGRAAGDHARDSDRSGADGRRPEQITTGKVAHGPNPLDW